ncbi:MAG: MarR family transcriptional regulator [Oscillospiraceae bacterium]|nr:MarR family transcriptional regulator [Oscillospiraceae bacterium]
MFKESFKEVFDKFKFQFFCRIFDLVRERDGSLTAMEAFSLEIIDMLQAPTVSQFADFLDISQSNATYKVNSLIRKGYLVRKVSDLDRREAHLILSEKYRGYMSLLTSYEDKVMDRIAARFPQEDLDTFDRILRTMSDELMPECAGIRLKTKEKG